MWISFAVYYRLARPVPKTVRRDPGSALARMAALAAVLALAILKPGWLVWWGWLFHRSWFFSPPLAALGLVVMLGGLALATWGRINLGELWSAWVEVKQGHRLVRRGAFALVRHPMYAGANWMLLGAFLLSGAPGWLALMAAAIPWTAWQIYLEERLMREHFGREWLDYRARVGAVIPRLRGRRY